MQLYERIRLLAQRKNIPLSKIAEFINIYPQKFNQWLTVKSQKNLWDHLPKILDKLPDVRPEWLYYGEEPMLEDGDGPRVAVPPLAPVVPLRTAEVPPLTTATSSMRTAMNDGSEATSDDIAAELALLREKLAVAQEANARLTDTNSRLTDEVLRLNEERRQLMERLAWEKMSDKIALSPMSVRGGTSEEH